MRLLLALLLDAILGMMVFLITVITHNLGDILLVGAVLTFPFWSFLLGFSGLSSIGLEGLGLRVVGLGGILPCGGTSLSMSSSSSMYLFLFFSSFFGGF